MRIIFCIELPYLPVSIAGAGKTLDAVIRRLQNFGHEVFLVAPADSTAHMSNIENMKEILPYPTFRSTNILTDLPALVQQWMPDVAVVRGTPEASKIINICVTAKVPVAFLVSSAFEQYNTNYYEAPFIKHIALSKFVATKLKCWANVNSTIIPPLIELEKYKVDNTNADEILFVNPVKEKGIYKVLEIAKLMPYIKFTIAESWATNLSWRNHIKKISCANIKLISAQEDLRPFYEKTKLLLVPSVWEEAWGRVVTEAQVSGIPVFANKRGGLPESVGNGGILFDLEAKACEWKDFIDIAFNIDSFYEELKKTTLIHSKRKEIQPETIINQWLDVLTQLNNFKF